MFAEYRFFPDGTKGPAEEENLIRNIGDQIMAVDGVPTKKKTLPEVIEMLAKTKGIKSPCVRFLEVHKDDVYTIKTIYQLRQSDALETTLSKPKPKQKPKLTPKTKLKPKLKDCSPQLPTKSKQHKKSKKPNHPLQTIILIHCSNIPCLCIPILARMKSITATISSNSNAPLIPKALMMPHGIIILTY